MPAGAPTKFRPEFADQLIEYFSVKPYKKLKKKPAESNDFPTLAGFAIKLGVHRTTLKEWADETNEDGSLKHPEFSFAYSRAKDFQENWLIINGLKGLVNANFGIFTAKNVLGWRDRQPGEEDKVNVVVNNLNQKTDEEIDARINQLMGKAGKVEP